MKIIQMKYVKLHDSVFLSRRNLSQTIDLDRQKDVTLTFDCESDFLLVELNGEVALIPRANCVNMVPINSKPYLVESIIAGMEAAETKEESLKAPRKTAKEPELTPIQKAKVKAQVSDPTRDPVFGQGN